MEVYQALYVSCVPYVVLALVFGVMAADSTWEHKNKRITSALASIGIATFLFLAATWTGLGS